MGVLAEIGCVCVYLCLFRLCVCVCVCVYLCVWGCLCVFEWGVYVWGYLCVYLPYYNIQGVCVCVCELN